MSRSLRVVDPLKPFAGQCSCMQEQATICPSCMIDRLVAISDVKGQRLQRLQRGPRISSAARYGRGGQQGAVKRCHRRNSRSVPFLVAVARSLFDLGR